MSRRAVTEDERQALNNIIGAQSTSESFYCTGSADYPDLKNPSLMYLVEGGSKAVSFNVAGGGSLDALHQDSEPSHFGQGQQRVMDESYRLARELISNRIGMNFDPLAQANGILQIVSTFCMKGIDIRLYKLNSYTTGGFFKLHKDTPKAENHIGTLLIGLPFAFTGGELLLTHGNGAATIDWSDTHLSALKEGNLALPWVFFYSDVEHEILPVKSGHRVTLSFDVYGSQVVTYSQPNGRQPEFDAKGTKLFDQLQHLLENPKVFPDGARLAFGLGYTYPFGTEEKVGGEINVAAFLGKLKGTDSVLYHALNAAGLEIKLKAVYKERYEEEEDYDDETGEYREVPPKSPVDEFSCLVLKGGSYRSPCVLMTSDSFSGIYEGELVEEMKTEVLRRDIGAEIGWDVVWVNGPKGFSLASTYIGYGNEPSIQYCYVAAAFMVDIPPVVGGRRQM